MKRLVGLLTLASVGAGACGLLASELKIMEPAEYSIVRGTVKFRVKPELEKGEKLASLPQVSFHNEQGDEVRKIAATGDPATGLTSGSVDTTKLPDGRYVLVFTYKTTVPEEKEPVDQEQEVVLGVRNGPAKPARVVVDLPDNKEFKGEDAAEVTVHVYDDKGKPMPAARVAFKVNQGDLGTSAEITDSMGEAFASVDSDKALTSILTVTVENLPPVTRTLKFIE